MASRKRLRERPSFTASEDVRKSIENQTNVSLGITKQLLLTLGKDKNMVYSPLSIHVVLSMIVAGSTKGHIQDRLLLFLKSKSIDELNDLASNVYPLVFADGASSGGPLLSFANGIWVEESCPPIKPSFKEVVDTGYRAALKQVDFKANYEQVRCEVNAWAEKRTNGLIKEIIPPGLLHSETRLILANALYFKGAWHQDQFTASRTRNKEFHLLNGRSVWAPFMTSSEDQRISAFDGFKVLKLPYEQGGDYQRRFSMFVFLPDARNGLQALVERVCSECGFIDHHLPKYRVPVDKFLIPKFKISAGFDALEVLNTLGFSLEAGDLTEMVEDTGIRLNKILHKSFIEVNEEGTEAAAVTVAMDCLCADEPEPEMDFVADHPFLYLIKEEVTGSVMFIGHVLNPIADEAI
ncbi:hypothetical protein M0R45_025179 [Rubus argutus]|uniref:Serpin domain-containing protein n=1 Tax=Rubus argutus TaxID=59490 RepID=A0AAW1WXA8_RUBAR